ncbi:hypothetical protein T01_15973 [Trichinella spiralis]|uniref:Integrase zinc-binding domain-containing protein n=1 Tax=Trichinella spiralis TaxID=6334 RepID=A0A0V1BL73_TRISP|nr:hypothetical protein T01_15973 [Trichinella spiralis]
MQYILSTLHGIKTAIAHGANGKRLVINCLLYRGAEQTLVTEDRARALGLVGVAETVIVKGIGGIHCTPTLARRVGFRLSLVKSVPVRCGDWKHLQHLRIAKEQDEKLPVHVLISVDSYGRFLDEKILRASTFQYRCHCAQIEDNMEQLLKKFWELKSIGIQHQEEKMTQDLVSDQFHRTLAYDGLRYSVGLLWKPGEIWLPDNRPLAEHRLQAVIRKDPVKRLEYTAVIGEYLRNGWAEEKMVNGGLKCRVVFDRSAKCGGVSLNECLETGPNVQADLMYLKVGLRVEDRDACRFLWRNCSQDEPVRAYRLTRMCFGLACSPYLAINVIKAHAERNPEECDEIIKRALSNMYVDDLVISCDEESEVAELNRRVPVFLKRGGFHLKKWAGNRAELLATLPRTEVSKIGDRELGKALSVYWLKDEDVITFKPPTDSTTQTRATKRQRLSLAAKAKMMFQWLWTTGLSWDSPLPPKISKQWRRWQEELEKLPEVKLSRPWIPHAASQMRRIELHVFGDASKAAYAACAYLRVESMDEQISVRLMIAKTRVTPIKPISLPRLELVAALLCARLKRYLEKEVTLPIQETLCCSDSKEIQGLVSTRQWKYCPTKENPANIPSRGRSLDELIHTNMWWHGPQPIPDNSYERLIRVATYCLRFTRSVQLPLTEREVDTNLSIAELWAAEVRWFKNEDGLLRTGGRLRQSTLPPESKHPILLPSHHPVVELLIRNQHIRQLHASVNQTLVAIRTRFWIIKAINTVKKVIRPCPICRRINAEPYQPVERVEELHHSAILVWTLPVHCILAQIHVPAIPALTKRIFLPSHIWSTEWCIWKS